MGTRAKIGLLLKKTLISETRFKLTIFEYFTPTCIPMCNPGGENLNGEFFFRFSDPRVTVWCDNNNS